MARSSKLLFPFIVCFLVFATQLAGDHTGGLLSLPAESIIADAVVATDGSGTDGSINGAVMRSAGFKSTTKYFIIHIKRGIYKEKVIIRRPNVVLIGDGAGQTVITSSLSNKSGHDMPNSATLSALKPGFMARDLTIENTAGAPDDKQAVAFRSTSQRSVLYRCEIKGFQDTLYAESGYQFYRDCDVSGTVDFIFGDAAALFQNCRILVRRPADIGQHTVVTAQGRIDDKHHSGFCFQNCTITTMDDLKNVEVYLGRPWKPRALVVFMLSYIGSFVHPAGWVEWSKGKPDDVVANSVLYMEYKNYGPGADVSNRTKWNGVHVLENNNAARPFTAKKFIEGGSWLPQTGVEYYLGLYK